MEGMKLVVTSEHQQSTVCTYILRNLDYEQFGQSLLFGIIDFVRDTIEYSRHPSDKKCALKNPSDLAADVTALPRAAFCLSPHRVSRLILHTNPVTRWLVPTSTFTSAPSLTSEVNRPV